MAESNIIENGFWKFSITNYNGIFLFKLTDKRTGRIYVDGNCYCCLMLKDSQEKKLCSIIYDEPFSYEADNGSILKIKGTVNNPFQAAAGAYTDPGTNGGNSDGILQIEQEYVLKRDSKWMMEYIKVTNISGGRLDLEDIHIALKRKLSDGCSGWVDGQEHFSLVSVLTRQYRSLRINRRSNSISAQELVYTGWEQQIPGYCEEGWLWGNKEGGLLVCKYNNAQMEFSRFESMCEPVKKTSTERLVYDSWLLLGGAASYKGIPEAALSLDIGDSYSFGVSKYAVYSGDWQQGYYLYREHLEEMGHILPKNFNPPVHWNEIYNLGWFGDGKERYTLKQLYEEAKLAQDIGAESLYLDPGWDTFPGSTIWDRERFGPLEEFVKTLQDKYGLKLALHLMQNFLSDNEDPMFYSLDEKRNQMRMWLLNEVCTNEYWVKEKSRRVLELADKNVDFFMFDFPEFSGGHGGTRRRKLVGCRCPDHGHEVPMSPQTHVDNVFKVIQNVKKKHPELIIEAQDRIDGGPTGFHAMYFQHGLSDSFDENWGYEYMWNPMLDLLSGRSLSLYDYNLGCSIPLYLHINESMDNENMLQFWWYASVVRHLGIGGVRKGEEGYERLKSAMMLFRKLKPYFAHGRFYGIDPFSHLHINEEDGTGVLTCYNLTGGMEHRVVRIDGGYKIKAEHVHVLDGTGREMDKDIKINNNGELVVSLDIRRLSPMVVVFGFI